MKVDVTYPRAVNAIVDFLDPLLDDCTVGVKLPADWTPASSPHLQVALDGTPTTLHPVAVESTIRLVAWSNSPTSSHDLVMEAHGRVLGHVGPEFAARPLTGPLDAADPQHANAALCAVTVRVRVRSTSLS